MLYLARCSAEYLLRQISLWIEKVTGMKRNRTHKMERRATRGQRAGHCHRQVGSAVVQLQRVDPRVMILVMVRQHRIQVTPWNKPASHNNLLRLRVAVGDVRTTHCMQPLSASHGWSGIQLFTTLKPPPRP